jgi:preprotein translocase subunit SecG
MATVLLIVHTLLALALIGVVLLQRSEGGALGIGGGGGGGFMTGRGTANFLTRVTAGLAAAFFATSMILSLVASGPQGPSDILDTKETTTKGQPKGKAPPPKSGVSKLPTIKLDSGASDAAPPKPEPPPRVPQSK